MNYDNAFNENKLNARKARSTVHQLKQLIKPILAVLRNYRKSPKVCYVEDNTEISDNVANEILENQLFEDIDQCDDFAAVPIYNNGGFNVVPVHRGQRFIPVHFAKTEAGTFFWTSMGADCDIEYGNQFSNHQLPEIQTPCDRWAQA